MITCPRCQNTLPDWAQTCQFCQTDVRTVQRPKNVPAPGRPLAATTAPQWVWGAYYALAGFFILEGVYDVVMAFVNSHQKFLGQELGFGLMGYISVGIGALTVLLGIGLLVHWNAARGIVNFFCGMRILFGIFGLLGSLGGVMLAGAIGVLFLLMNIIDIASAAFMIFLIGETEKSAPNI